MPSPTLELGLIVGLDTSKPVYVLFMGNSKSGLHFTSDKSDFLYDQMVKEKHRVRKARSVGMRR